MCRGDCFPVDPGSPASFRRARKRSRPDRPWARRRSVHPPRAMPRSRRGRLAIEHDFDVPVAAGAGGAELVRAAQLHLTGTGELDFLQSGGNYLDIGIVSHRQGRERLHLVAGLHFLDVVEVVGSFCTPLATLYTRAPAGVRPSYFPRCA